MDFIERVFHVSLDGGTGSLEGFYLLVTVAALVTIALRRKIIDAFKGVRILGRPF